VNPGRSERKRFGRVERHGAAADEFCQAELSYPLRTMAMTAPGRTVRTEEDVMHPVIAEAIAAERARELQAAATAAGRARRLRQSRRPWLLMGILDAGRVPVLSVTGPLRGPRHQPAAGRPG
jgi:hypothetical protein